MGPTARRIWRWSAGVLAAIAILSALVVAGLRIAFDSLPGYQAQVAAQVRALTGLELRFKRLDARLGWSGPEVFFEEAAVLMPNGREVLVSAAAGRVSFSLWRSAINRRIEVGRIALEKPRINVVILDDERVELVGQSMLPRASADGVEGFNLGKLRQGRLLIADATVRFVDLRSHEAWEVTDVTLDLTRDGGGLRFDGHVDLPRRLGSSIDLDGELQGDLGNFDAVAWKARATARNADLGGWARLVPASLSPPLTGRGYLRVMGSGTGRRFDGGRLALELRDVWVGGNEGPAERYKVIAGEYRLERQGARWALSGKDVEFSRPGAPWSPASLEASVTLGDGRLQAATLRTKFLDLYSLAPIARVLPAGALHDALVAADPSGQLRDVSLTLAWNDRGAMPSATGGFSFEDLGIGAIGRAPGLRGLAGRLDATGDVGKLSIASQGVEFRWPSQFRDVIGLTAGLTAGWRSVPNGVQLWVDDARLDTGHGRASASLRMLLPGDGSTPLMNLSGVVTDAEVTQTWRYLPIGMLSPGALSWLDPAFRAGKLTHGTISIVGPVHGFPYREGQGLFKALAHIEGLTLDYATGWAPLEGATADAEFVNVGLRARSSVASVRGIPLGPVEAEIADWREMLLLVRTSAEAPVKPVLDFLQLSPLGKTLGPSFMGLTGAGRVSGDVVLFLPIKRFKDRAINATARLEDVTLGTRDGTEQLTHLAGTLTVMNRELYMPRFTAEALGGAVAGTLNTRRGKREALLTVLEARGRFDGQRLQKFAKLPLNSGLEGSTDYALRVDIDRPSSTKPSKYLVKVDSSLVGMAMGLPGPLTKPASKALPISISVDAGAPDVIASRIELADVARAQLEFRKPGEHWQIDRGEAVFGSAREPVLADEPGLRITGSVPRASLSEVLDLRWAEPSKRRVSEWLTLIDLSVGEAEALGYAFDRPHVRMVPGNEAWQIDVDGPMVRGRLTVPFEFPGQVPMVLDMDRLHVGERVRAGGGEIDPRRLPSIRFDVRDLLFDRRRFGAVRAELTRGTQGLSLGRLDVHHADFQATGRGGWIVDESGAQRCNVAIDATSTNVAGFLKAMGYAPMLESNQGKGRADLSWPGGPDGSFYERLNGTIKLSLGQGRIPELDPGAGRVLGLMSLAHLPRRLALDFKDVTGEGLVFDSIGGDFSLKSGEAYTRNLTLRGSAAEIGVVGRTNLRTRQYDQTAVVTGDIGGTIGLAGVLAGGPAIGAALLLFTQVFKEPLKGMTRAYYRISGSWDQPNVERIGAAQARESREEPATQTPETGGPQ